MDSCTTYVYADNQYVHILVFPTCAHIHTCGHAHALTQPSGSECLPVYSALFQTSLTSQSCVIVLAEEHGLSSAQVQDMRHGNGIQRVYAGILTNNEDTMTETASMIMNLAMDRMWIPCLCVPVLLCLEGDWWWRFHISRGGFPHAAQMAAVISETGGIRHLVKVISETSAGACRFSLMALYYLCQHRELHNPVSPLLSASSHSTRCIGCSLL